MTIDTTDLIGYIASVLIVASFLVPNNMRLTRLINMGGAILFVIYGYLINSYPVIIPNVFIILVQLYYLFFYKKKA